MCRRGVFDDMASFHEVCYITRKAGFMRNNQHAHSFFGQVAHHAQHVVTQFRIESRCRLIEQDQVERN